MKTQRFSLWAAGLVASLLILAAFVATGSGVTVAQSDPTPVAPRSPHGGGDTLSLLQNTMIPPRDRLDLAERFLGVSDIPAPPATPPPVLAVGAEEMFWIDNLEEDMSSQIQARLVYETAHIYVFVEDGKTVDLQAIQRSTDTFENTILPKVHAVFGEEWSPGIDGDPHLYILHAANLGGWTAAYYGSTSEYPVEAVANSNQHEMFFVNLDTMGRYIGTSYYEGVLAHEFQHMVHWHVDQNEDSWTNEGLSELAAMLTGYGSSEFAPDFLRAPDLQLNTWPEDDPMGLHYGSSFMFMAYFYERYGEAATTTLVRDPANGLVSIEDTLDTLGATDPTTGAPVTLVDLFGDWLVANLLQDPTVGDGRYAYANPDMAGLPKAAITATASTNGVPLALAAPQWGPNYIQVPGGANPQTVRVTFKGAGTVSIAPADAHSGQFMWWSNRSDESDTRLTHAFDLTGVSSATLNFWTWYYIENLWDYAYVTVSTDGGTTWTALATPRTTTDDPHGNGYGPGYTGQSNGWVQESVDLTPYAGQNILVRFEYITDDAVTQPGMLIDDVSVPEIGYVDDFENGDGGWTNEGWLLTNNVLPQHFLVQWVQPGNTAAPVTRLLGPDDAPQGEWEIPLGGAQGDAVIVVSGLAPVTTESAPYTLTIAPVG